MAVTSPVDPRDGRSRDGSGPPAPRGLTDDALTVQPPAASVRAYLREAVDRLAGADPGLTQLRTALQAVLGIAVAVAAVDGFVNLTGALQLPASAGPAPVITAENHALLIVSMLLAGMVAMMAGFTVHDATPRGQLLSTAVLPVPMIAAMALGLALGSYRVVSLIYLVVLLAGGVYVRRWGPRGFAAGLVAFNGGFLGFFLHKDLGLHDVGWLAADLLIGLVASLLVRFVIFRPHPVRTLVRMRRSWDARARRLLLLSAEILGADVRSDAGAPDPRAGEATTERLRRQVVRLNESTLMIDAQLPLAVPDTAAARAQRLFEAELALANLARFAAALVSVGAPAPARALGHAGLTALLAEDWDTARAAADRLRAYVDDNARLMMLAHRLGGTIDIYATARVELETAPEPTTDGSDPEPFTPAIGLNSGFLPGSVTASTAASTTPGRGGLLDRAAMPTYVRASIQAGVAGSIAVVVGDLLSGPRLYWAVLSTFLAFMATTNSGEQVRKALFRVGGTVVGIVVGDLLVRVTGGQVWLSLGIVLVALFFGIYLIRVNYTFMVIGVTVTMSQLYKQLGEFSWHLLVLRLGETAIGVGAVVITVLFIVPLRPQRVLSAGVLLWFRALTSAVDESLDRLTCAPDAPTGSLRPAVRSLDAAYAGLEATAAPLRRATFGRNSDQLGEIRTVSAAARGYARSLAAAVESVDACDLPGLPAAAEQLRASAAAIDTRIATGEHGTYVRSAALVEMAARALPAGDSPLRLALRDLTLLDGALARLAAALAMTVADHDPA